MSRVYNFSAGPSMLPLEVLKKAQEELLDYKGSGQSVMETKRDLILFIYDDIMISLFLTQNFLDSKIEWFTLRSSLPLHLHKSP